jgi:hypothetical protein
MTASSYDLPSRGLGARLRERISLPRPRVAGLGGGVGLVIVAVGLLVIGLGWNGMAGGGGEVNGVPNLNAQLPWLLSGGILGLALVVFGAAMLIVNNARTDRARLEAKLDELVLTLSRSGTGGAAVMTRSLAEGTFLAGGSSYHRPDCRLVQGRDDVSAVTAAEAQQRHLQPCRVCHPA